jgi:signal transduction histidine kinase
MSDAADQRDAAESATDERPDHTALRVLLRIAGVVTDPAVRADPAALLSAVTAALAQLEPADFAHALLIEQTSWRLTPLAIHGVSPDQEAAWRADIVAFRPGPDAGLVTLRDQLLAGHTLKQEFTSDRPIISLATVQALHVRAAISAPVIVDGQLVGMLSISRTRPRDPGAASSFAAWDEELLAGVARLTGEALERGRIAERLTTERAARLAAEEATRQRDEFLSIASHELKTPLTSLRSYTQAARRRLDRVSSESAGVAPFERAQEPAQERAQERALNMVRDVLERIERQSDRLGVLVDDLLDVARIEAGRLMLRRVRADLAAICRQAGEDQRHSTGRAITLDLPATPVQALIDPDRIEQVVTNLLSNALKYSTSEAPVHLDLRTAAGLARVAVRDEGPGLPLDERERVFERFHRAPDIEVRSGSGVGLGIGLFISREIVERHNGRIWVESEPGCGTTFLVELPLR